MDGGYEHEPAKCGCGRGVALRWGLKWVKVMPMREPVSQGWVPTKWTRSRLAVSMIDMDVKPFRKQNANVVLFFPRRIDCM